MYRISVRKRKMRGRRRANKNHTSSIKLASEPSSRIHLLHPKTKKRTMKHLGSKTRKSATVRKRKVGGYSGATVNVPVFIISYNQYTYLKSMVEQLSKYPNMTLYVIDNKSTYPPLVEYLKSIEGTVKVLYQPENYGHKVYERDEIIALGGDYYVVTDPDLLLNPKLPQNFIEQMIQLSDKYKTNKIGFALDIKNNINLNRKIKVKSENSGIHSIDAWKKFEGTTIPEWENKFWINRIDNPDYELYKAPIDTTFALINKKFYQKGNIENCIRIAGDFTAVHRTWLDGYEKEMKEGEYEFYLGASNKSSTTKLWRNNTNTAASTASGST